MTRKTGSHRRRNGEGPWVETHGPRCASTSLLQTGSLSRTGEEVQGLEEVRGGAEEICQEGQIDHGASPIRRCTSVVSVTSATASHCYRIPSLPQRGDARSTRGEGYCGDCPIFTVGDVLRALRQRSGQSRFPDRRSRRSMLTPSSPTISTRFPLSAYLCCTESNVATVEASHTSASVRSMTTRSGSPA